MQRTPHPNDLEVGRKLKSLAYHGKVYEAEIVQGEGDEHLVKVGSETFKTLSAAGQSVTGTATRGGVFWGLITLPQRPKAGAEQPTAEAETPEQPKAAKPKSSARAKRSNGKAQRTA